MLLLYGNGYGEEAIGRRASVAVSSKTAKRILIKYSFIPFSFLSLSPPNPSRVPIRLEARVISWHKTFLWG